MSTAIALVSRFYGFELENVMKMTMRQFATMLEEIANVLKLELGEEQEQSLTGEQGWALAKRMFPRGRK